MALDSARPGVAVEASRQEDVERLLTNQPPAKVYTSPRLLQHLTAGKLLGPRNEDCQTHELLLITGQTDITPPGTAFLSCVCIRCHLHFHIKSEVNPDVSARDNHTMHMFILEKRSNRDQLRVERAGNYALEEVKLFCIYEKCGCKLSIQVLPRRLSTREMNNFTDGHRVQRHLVEARAQEPDRFNGVVDTFGQEPIRTFIRFLQDGIKHTEGEPRRIKKHNKLFMVSFKDDFDDLLRSLGFTEHVLDDDEEAWVFPTLEVASYPTPIGTQRSKWQDVLAELMLLILKKDETYDTGDVLKPAWGHLEDVLCTNYEAIPRISNISDEDMELLGCLAEFKPVVISWATILLAERCPSRRDEFLTAGKNCVVGRDDLAELDLITYLSRFDSEAMNGDQQEIVAAFKYFNSTPTEGRTHGLDHFIAQALVNTESDPTTAGKERAQKYLEVVQKYLDSDLAGAEGSQNLALSQGHMNLQQALKFLGIEADYTAELIRGFVNLLALNPAVDRAKAAEALDIVAQYKRQNSPKETAESEFTSIKEMMGVFTDAQFATKQNVEEEAARTTTPPGLSNIGNTCYLNSLLQYFHNVKPLRNLVLNYPENELGLDEESIRSRRIGGNAMPVNLDEAIVGKLFVQLLQQLFNGLKTTTERSIEPPQALANTALKSASALLEKPKVALPETKPPPLPARPAPAVVTVEPIPNNRDSVSAASSQTLVDDELGDESGYVEVKPPDSHFVQEKETFATDSKAAEITVTELEPSTDPTSSPQDWVTMTVTNQPGRPSVSNVVSSDLNLDEKVELISQRLQESDRKGTDQQDVGEIIGIILEHIMRSIRSDGPMHGVPVMPDQSGPQADMITETFFPLVVNYTQNPKESMETARKEIIPSLWITAFPHEEPGKAVTIYEALDQSNDVEYVAGLARYSAIASLPPIMHICIQRSGAAVKNDNPVIISEELYMDRYMETDRDSRLGMERRKFWAIKEFLGELKTEKDSKHREKLQGGNVQENVTAEATYELAEVGDAATVGFKESLPNYACLDRIIPTKVYKHPNIGPGVKSAQPLNQSSLIMHKPAPAKKQARVAISEDYATPFSRIIGDITESYVDMSLEQLRSEKQESEHYFDSLKQKKYVLHAVICHGGTTKAGHYWSWIRDLKTNAWLQYNDATVKVDPRDSQSILDELNTGGLPYYLAYVRDDVKHDMVEVPEFATKSNADDTPGIDTPEAVLNKEEADIQTIDGIELDAGMPDLVRMPSNKYAVQDSDVMDVDEPPPYDIL